MVLRYFAMYYPHRYIYREVRGNDCCDWLLTPKYSKESRELIHALIWAYKQARKEEHKSVSDPNQAIFAFAKGD